MPSVTLDLFPAKFEIFISFSHLLFLTLFPRLCKNMICYPLTPREVVHGHYSSLQLLCGRGFMLVLVRTFYALFVFSLSNSVAGLEACNNGQGQLEFEIEYKANFYFHFVSLKVLEIKDSYNITPPLFFCVCCIVLCHGGLRLVGSIYEFTRSHICLS